jgi:DNA ligase D-like protein (predicted 3'-phosphoesterase)
MLWTEYRRPGRHRPRHRRQHRANVARPCFVIAHHLTRNEHYDFRLEIEGMLASWKMPRDPSVSPSIRRMARRAADHPLEDATLEGVIPDGADGPGGVIVWDHGSYANGTHRDMAEGLERGHLLFYLYGKKLQGGYAITRVREGDDETWLLVKRRTPAPDRQ